MKGLVTTPTVRIPISLEILATTGGVDYDNDSKGTNPEAAVKAIEAMVKPTILIGGGYDKGSEFDLYVKAFKDKVKLLVLIGQTSAKILIHVRNMELIISNMLIQ